MQSIRDGIELPHEDPHRVEARAPTAATQPHRTVCHTQRSYNLYPLPMVITGPQATPNPEPCIVDGKPRVWGDMRENGEDGLVWEFENCENGRNKLGFGLES